MGQILHGRATTTYRIRKEIQTSEKTAIQLAKQYGINVKTVLKWRKRTHLTDKVTGPSKGFGSSLSELEQQIICNTRLKSKLSLDDLFDVLEPQIPSLSRSNLHRCLQRNGLSQLPKVKKDIVRKQFKTYEPGYLHIDVSVIMIAKKKYYLFVSIDRNTKYVFVECHDNKRIDTSVSFLKSVIKEYPFKLNKILTDNGMEFTYNCMPKKQHPKNKLHPFDQLCVDAKIEHRLTLFRHPWTNGQVEVMNKKIKENTTKKYKYDTIEELKSHLYYFLIDYNFNRKLRAINRQTPWNKVLKEYKLNSNIFTQNPNHKTLGQNN